MSFNLLQPIDAGKPFEGKNLNNNFICFYHLKNCKGVYVFVKNDGEVLYVGEAYEVNPDREGLRSRIPKHYTPGNTGGTFRQNFCNKNCRSKKCPQCRCSCSSENERSFRRFKELLKSSKIHVSVAYGETEGRVLDLERALICELNPKYNESEIQQEDIDANITEQVKKIRNQISSHHS